MGLFVLNRVLVVNREEVRKARRDKAFTKHLKAGTEENPQPHDARCPSNNAQGIECSCVDASFANRLLPTYASSVGVVPSNTVSDWLEKFEENLYDDVVLGPWRIRQAYSENKSGSSVPRLTLRDRDLLEWKPHEKRVYGDNFNCHADASSMFTITTKGCWKKHVSETMREWVTFIPEGKARQVNQLRSLDLIWGRVVLDECHQSQSTGGALMGILLGIGPRVRKWFMSGTPFESSPDQMANWYLALERSWPQELAPTTVPWARRDEYRENLQFCTYSEIKKMGKRHKQLIKTENPDPAELSAHFEVLSKLLKTSWIRRTPKSIFLGKEVLDIPPLTHQDVDCFVPPQFKVMMSSETDIISNAVRAEHDVALKTWNDNGQHGPQPVLQIISWLKHARRMRILSTFPRLGTLAATKNLTFSGKEDREKGWVRPKKDKVYELEEVDSPYERWIEDICSHHNSSKMECIDQLIRDTWDQGEKAIFVTMGPTSALILYWVSVTNDYFV